MQTKEIDATALETLLAAAVAAPSIHNTQPWRFGFDLGTRAVTVHADRSRALALADPHGRALCLSAGSAVLNLRVAAAHLGWQPVPHLLPDPGIDGYLVRAELRQDQRMRKRSTSEFGLVVSHARVSAGGDSVLHSWLTAGFNESDLTGFTDRVVRFCDYAALERPLEPPVKYHHLGPNIPIPAPALAPVKPPWQVLEVEVSPAGITVRPFAGEGCRVSIGETEANDRLVAVAAAFPR